MDNLIKRINKATPKELHTLRDNIAISSGSQTERTYLIALIDLRLAPPSIQDSIVVGCETLQGELS